MIGPSLKEPKSKHNLDWIAAYVLNEEVLVEQKDIAAFFINHNPSDELLDWDHNFENHNDSSDLTRFFNTIN